MRNVHRPSRKEEENEPHTRPNRPFLAGKLLVCPEEAPRKHGGEEGEQERRVEELLSVHIQLFFGSEPEHDRCKCKRDENHAPDVFREETEERVSFFGFHEEHENARDPGKRRHGEPASLVEFGKGFPAADDAQKCKHHPKRSRQMLLDAFPHAVASFGKEPRSTRGLDLRSARREIRRESPRTETASVPVAEVGRTGRDLHGAVVHSPARYHFRCRHGRSAERIQKHGYCKRDSCANHHLGTCVLASILEKDASARNEREDAAPPNVFHGNLLEK